MLGKELFPAVHGRVTPAAPSWRRPPAPPAPGRRAAPPPLRPPRPPKHPRPDAALAAAVVIGRRVQARERAAEDAATAAAAAGGRRRGREAVVRAAVLRPSGGAVVCGAPGGRASSADFCGGALDGDGPRVESVLIAQRAELFVPVFVFSCVESIFCFKFYISAFEDKSGNQEITSPQKEALWLNRLKAVQ